MPPSTRTPPWTKLAAGESRNAITRAISSGSAGPPVGIWSSRAKPAVARVGEGGFEHGGARGPRRDGAEAHARLAPVLRAAPDGDGEGELRARVGQEAVAPVLEGAARSGFVAGEERLHVGRLEEGHHLGRVRRDRDGGGIVAPLERGSSPSISARAPK